MAKGTQLKRAGTFLGHAANKRLGQFSDRLPERRPVAPPTFIVGPPRTGSTFLSQLLTANFDIGYLSNAHCALYGAPDLVERLRPANPPSSFTSSYGRTPRPWGQSECGGFWYRFFPHDPQAADAETMPTTDRRRLRRAVDRLSAASGRPFVFKNLVNSVRLGALLEVFPDALWLVMRRSLLDTVASILRARQDQHGTTDVWWSVEPHELAELRQRPPIGQVVGQAQAIWDAIDERAAGSSRFFDVSYEHLVQNPADTLDRVLAFARQNGANWTRRRADVLPTSTPPDTPRLSAELRAGVGKWTSLSHSPDRPRDSHS